MNGMMTGVVLGEQTRDTSVSSFSLESSEWVTMNLDTGAGSQHIPIELWSRRNRRWKFLRLDPSW